MLNVISAIGKISNAEQSPSIQDQPTRFFFSRFNFLQIALIAKIQLQTSYLNFQITFSLCSCRRSLFYQF